MARDQKVPANNLFCPLCGKVYYERNIKTKHHIFPSYWYGPKGKVKPLKNRIYVLACECCHLMEFNHFYPMVLDKPWTTSECIANWIKFCSRKGKDALKVYPQLGKLFV